MKEKQLVVIQLSPEWGEMAEAAPRTTHRPADSTIPTCSGNIYIYYAHTSYVWNPLYQFSVLLRHIIKFKYGSLFSKHILVVLFLCQPVELQFVCRLMIYYMWGRLKEFNKKVLSLICDTGINSMKGIDLTGLKALFVLVLLCASHWENEKKTESNSVCVCSHIRPIKLILIKQRLLNMVVAVKKKKKTYKG